MIDVPNDPYYFTAKHKRWRAAVLRRAKFLCEECARYGRRTEAQHAHHIKPRKAYPDLATVVSNGRALCAACHAKIELREREKAARNSGR
jgi:5-methylcytosine-specific restriction endonuclease McrA